MSYWVFKPNGWVYWYSYFERRWIRFGTWGPGHERQRLRGYT